MDHTFAVLEIVSIVYDNTVLAKVIAEVWEHGDVSTIKSDMATNMSHETTRVLQDHLNHFIWG